MSPAKAGEAATVRDGDAAWMALALALAERGRGGTSPNPMVGAVVVRDGVVIGHGWHRRAGEPHAEPNALADAHARGGPDAARGATIYVTLEPCCHRGAGKRTPPCTDALIAAGVARVVVAALDPNPRVAGRGVDALRAAGVEVTTGIEVDLAERLNVVFTHWMQRAGSRPYVRLKLAQSLDGRIAPRPGSEYAVTGEVAQRRVHRLRADSDAVLVGRTTAAIDDPRLTVREVAGDWLPPLRVVVDSHLSIGPEALVHGRAPGGSAVITTVAADDPRAVRLALHGVEILSVPADAQGHVDLAAGLARLAARQPPVTSLLVEGGGHIAASLLAAGLVDELRLHVAPVVFGAGGVPAFAPLEGPCRLRFAGAEPLGDDLELTYLV